MQIGFENVWLIAWGLVAAIPLILYLLQRRQVEQVSWAAMQFLREPERTPVQLFNWRQLVLLLIRMLIPLLIGLAAAAPFLGRPATPLDEGPSSKHWILVFDTSHSMNHQVQQQTAIDEARESALEILRTSNPSDSFAVVSAGSGTPRVPLRGSRNHETVKQVINNLPAESGVFDLALTLQLVENLVTQTKADANSVQVVLFSDLARHSWNVRADSDQMILLESISRFAQLLIVPCAQTTRPNIAVSQLSSSKSRATIGETIFFEARISGFQLTSPQSVQVDFSANQRNIDRQTVVVPAQSSVAISFEHQASQQGDNVFQVAVSADNLAADDTRQITVPVNRQIRLLSLEGSPGAARSVDLATGGLTQSALPAIANTVATVDQSATLNLSHFDCICLVDVANISGPLRESMQSFIDLGGSVLVFAGPGSTASVLNQLTDNLPIDDQRLAVFDLAPVTGNFLFDPRNYEHPAISAFEDFPRSGLVDVPIWKYLRARLVEDQVRRIVDFNNGDPAIFEFSVGSGRIVFCTTAIGQQNLSESEQWNALEAWWSFVPLINETLTWMFSTSHVRQNLLVGQSIVYDLDVSNFRRRLSVSLPDGQQFDIDESASSSTNDQIDVVTATMPGVYRVQLHGEDASRGRLFSINIDSHEADLRRVDLDGLSRYLSLETNSRPDLPASPQKQNLFMWVLVALLIAMVIEVVLAERFSRDAALR